MHAPERTTLRATVGFALLGGVTTLSLLFAWVGTESLALVAAAGVGLGLLAPGLALWNLAGLRASGPSERTAFAGLPTELDLTLRRERWPAARDLLVSVEDARRTGAAPTGHVPRLGAEPRVVRCRPRFGERGRRAEVRVVVESGFPLGLFVVRRELRLPIDLVVLPRITRLGELARPLRRLAGRSEAAPRGLQGQGDFHALREWRPGEPVRGVAWKPSARRGRLLARELCSEEHPRFRVVLCTRVEGLAPHRRHPPFERAVQLAASLLDHLLRAGRGVALSIDGRRLPPLAGRADLGRALVALAEVEPREGRPVVPAAGAGEVPLVVLAGGGAPPPAPEAGLLIDVESESGAAVFEASARAHVRRLRGGTA